MLRPYDHSHHVLTCKKDYPHLLQLILYGLLFCCALCYQMPLSYAHEPLRVYELDSTNINRTMFTYHEGNVYYGNEREDERIIYKFKQHKLYRVLRIKDKIKENCLYTFDNHRIYRGDSTDSEDCLFTFYKGKIYNGYILTKENVLYTFSEGKIYRGYFDEDTDANVLYTIKDRKIYRGTKTDKKHQLYAFKAKKDDWYRVYYSSSKQAVFTFTRLNSDLIQYPCSRMKYIRMLGLIDFLSLGLIDSPWSMTFFALQMNDAVANCID